MLSTPLRTGALFLPDNNTNSRYTCYIHFTEEETEERKAKYPAQGHTAIM